MPFFEYKAISAKGVKISGKVEAVNLDVAANILREKGLTIIDVFQSRKIEFLEQYLDRLLHKVSVKDLLIFLRQLSVLISANISLVQSLRIIEKQTENKTLKPIIIAVADEVEGGNKLSDSLSCYPRIFNTFHINIIKSGETSGKLDEVLNYLADEQEKDYEMMKKITGAMIYPAFILSGLLVVGVVMMIYVVPKLTAVLIESGTELPATTRILIKASEFFTNFWWAALIGLAVTFFIFKVIIKTKKGKHYWDILKLHAPIFGKILRKIYLVRLARSFITLISGGVTIVASLEVVVKVVDNSHYQNLIQKTIREVKDGRSIAGEFFNDKFVPPMFAQMMAIGEESGRITHVLGKMTDFYTLEIEDTMGKIMTIMEPFIMIIMGIAVGTMVAAIIMPMYNLSNSF
ncbi:type II secretion system F family protein [Candidatus Parcubacteria bacterium]|nr:type II secretion system F family protein [Candidatus Parcubacteria bacterium]